MGNRLHKNFMKSGRITEHFWLSEFACKGEGCCGGSAPINFELVFRLEALRGKLGKALTVNSGFRCEKHNARTDGASKTSWHRLGCAADIRKIRGGTVHEMAVAARKLGLYVIEYPWGIHVDLRLVYL